MELNSSQAHKTLTINLTSLKEDDRPVYIAGDFNGWNAQGAEYMLIKKDSQYQIDLSLPSELTQIAFKFTRGGWENGEIDKHGNITPNRIAATDAGSVDAIVERWRTNWSPFKKEYLPIIKLVSDAFEIPQLHKTRRVWALLPHDYDKDDQHYPVLYLQDAQNLFNESSEFGNWEIDKKLSILAEYGWGDVIIVAVEHGEEDRAREYTLGPNKVLEGSEGKKMIRFMADTLKTYIDQNYRTLPGRETTGIGGSSLGGLISIYAGFLYPEVYSKLMIFSPSLWAAPNLNFPMLPLLAPFVSRVYMYAGDNESAHLVTHVKSFVSRMQEQVANIAAELVFKTSIRPGGQHNEFYWAQEFPRALEWLFFDSKEDPHLLRSRTKSIET